MISMNTEPSQTSPTLTATSTTKPSTNNTKNISTARENVANNYHYESFVAPQQLNFSDSGLLDDIMSHIFDYNVNHLSIPGSLYIVFTCSSLGSTYAYLVPQILSHYLKLAQTNSSFHAFKDLTANVVHVIPSHKTIKAESSDDPTQTSAWRSKTSNSSSSVPATAAAAAAVFSSHRSDSSLFFTGNHISNEAFTTSTFQSFNGVYDIHESGSQYSISPKNSIFPPAAMASLLKTVKGASALNGRTDPFSHCQPSSISLNTSSSEHVSRFPPSSLPQSPVSPLLSPVVSVPIGSISPNKTGNYDSLADRIFNTFAFMPHQIKALVVPPNSIHYNFALYPLPSHVLPSFQDVIHARFTETLPSGLMVVCYPTSLALYYKYILPCLDLALHQLLALNLISTQACEAITVPPQSHVYTFEAQRALVEQLPNAEIVYSRKIEEYKPTDWGYRWVSEDMLWIRQTLAGLDVSSQSIIKLISMLTRNPLWSESGSCDISLFVVRKRSFTSS